MQRNETNVGVIGLPFDKDPFLVDSPFRIRVKADFGSFASVYSEYATLTISSPCFKTAI